MFKKPDKREKKDPLKQNPLPQPGDSAYDALQELVDDKLLFWLLAIIIALIVTFGQWIAWWRPKLIHPGIMTALTIVILIVGAVKFRSAWKQAMNLRLGVRGEMAVGQRLEELRAKGYRVYHDIDEKRYNIDHVLIGPGGVFVIETKTHSKPASGDARVTYDGQRVLINGHEPDRNPVTQAKACADRIGEILEKATGHRPKIRPVVLYPDWWVDPQPKGVEVWVLHPDALPGFLDHEDVHLAPEEIALFASALETHIRASA